MFHFILIRYQTKLKIMKMKFGTLKDIGDTLKDLPHSIQYRLKLIIVINVKNRILWIIIPNNRS